MIAVLMWIRYSILNLSFHELKLFTIIQYICITVFYIISLVIFVYLVRLISFTVHRPVYEWGKRIFVFVPDKIVVQIMCKVNYDMQTDVKHDNHNYVADNT